MDTLTRKEYEGLKEDIRLRDISIDIEKQAFERELKNGLGERIKNELITPPKSNWWFGLKLKFERWKIKKRDKRKMEGLF
jgi:hypothetical protein